MNGEEEDSEPPQKKYKTKFDWAGVMHQVIKKKGEISVKKLRKKVGMLREIRLVMINKPQDVN